MPRIVDEMKIRGFDKAEPVTIWKETNKLIDGHQRDAAATEAGLKNVWAIYKSFPDEAAAVAYSVKRQVNRRSTDDATLMKLLPVVDQRKPQGGDRRSEKAQTMAASEAAGRSAERTAELIGTSKTKIEKMRAIQDAGDEQLIADVKAGRTSVNAAHKKVLAPKKANQDQPGPASPKQVAKELLGVTKLIEPIAVKTRVFDANLADEVSAAGKPLRVLSERIAAAKSEGKS
jgi:ParB family chromosome partitioning protein